MDDFQKMLAIVERVEARVDELSEEVKSLNRFRWKVEGMLFISSGLVSAIVAIAVELMRK